MDSTAQSELIQSLRQDIEFLNKRFNDAIFKMVVKGEVPSSEEVKQIENNYNSKVDGDPYVTELQNLIKLLSSSGTNNVSPEKNADSRDQLMDLQRQLEERDSKNNDYLATIRSLQRVDILEQTTSESNDKVWISSTELQALKEQFENSESIIKQQATVIESLQQTKPQPTHNEEPNDQIALSSDQLVQLKQLIDEKEAKLTESETLVHSLQVTITSQQEANQQLQTQLEELQTKTSELETYKETNDNMLLQIADNISVILPDGELDRNNVLQSFLASLEQLKTQLQDSQQQLAFFQSQQDLQSSPVVKSTPTDINNNAASPTLTDLADPLNMEIEPLSVNIKDVSFQLGSQGSSQQPSSQQVSSSQQRASSQIVSPAPVDTTAISSYLLSSQELMENDNEPAEVSQTPVPDSTPSTQTSLIESLRTQLHQEQQRSVQLQQQLDQLVQNTVKVQEPAAPASPASEYYSLSDRSMEQEGQINNNNQSKEIEEAKPADQIMISPQELLTLKALVEDKNALIAQQAAVIESLQKRISELPETTVVPAEEAPKEQSSDGNNVNILEQQTKLEQLALFAQQQAETIQQLQNKLAEQDTSELQSKVDSLMQTIQEQKARLLDSDNVVSQHLITIEKLNQQIADLKKTCDFLSNQNTQYEQVLKHYAQLKEQVKNLQEDYTEEKERNNDLRMKVQESPPSSQEHLEFCRELEGMVQHRKQLLRDCEEDQKVKSEKQSQIDELKSNLEKVTQQYESTVQESQQLHENIKVLQTESKAQELQRALDTAVKQREDLTADLQSLQMEHEKAVVELNDEKEKRQVAEGDLASAKNELEQTQSKKAQAEEKFKAEISKLEEQLKKVAAEAESAKSKFDQQVETLQALLTQTKKERKQATKAREVAEANHKQLEEELKEAKEKATELQTVVTEMKAEIKTAQTEAAKAKKLTKQVEQLTSQLESLQKEHSQLEEKHETAAKQHKATKQELKEAAAKIESLTKKEKELEESLRKSTAAVDSLKIQNQELESNTTSLTEERDQFKFVGKQQQQELEKNTAAIQALQKELETLKTEKKPHAEITTSLQNGKSKVHEPPPVESEDAQKSKKQKTTKESKATDKKENEPKPSPKKASPSKTNEEETDGKSKKRKVGLALHPKKAEEEVPAEEAPKDEPKNNKSKSESAKSESTKPESTKTSKDASGTKKGLMSHVCTYHSVLVSFSGFKDDDPKYTCALREKLTEMIYKLKGEVIKNQAEFDSTITHVVTPPNVKTMKTLAAALTHRWIVAPEWISDSAAAGKFLPEASYGKKYKERVFQGKNFYMTKSFQKENQKKDFKIKNAELLIVMLGKGHLVDEPSQAHYAITASTNHTEAPEETKQYSSSVVKLNWNQLIEMIPGCKEEPSLSPQKVTTKEETTAEQKSNLNLAMPASTKPGLKLKKDTKSNNNNQETEKPPSRSLRLKKDTPDEAKETPAKKAKK